MRYLLLHRALKNAGDFLIADRALSLIRLARPNAEISLGEAWRPLRDQFAPEELDSFSAIIIGGGPGFQRNMYPRLYPLAPLPGLSQMLLLLALGSQVFPGTPSQLTGYRLDASTVSFLKWVEERSGMLGARDQVSAALLRGNGIERVTMTGDPAWYDLDRIDEPMQLGRGFGQVGFTPPASAILANQACRLLDRLVSLGMRPTVIWHRGSQAFMEPTVRRLNLDTVDITGSSAGFAVYDEIGAHIGYRVHAHLYALSRGIVSYLIAEDSRGIGVHATLGMLGVSGVSNVPQWMRRVHRIEDRLQLGRYATATSAIRTISSAPEVGQALVDQVTSDMHNKYARHEEARQRIRVTLPAMLRVLDRLP